MLTEADQLYLIEYAMFKEFSKELRADIVAGKTNPEIKTSKFEMVHNIIHDLDDLVDAVAEARDGKVELIKMLGSVYKMWRDA